MAPARPLEPRTPRRALAMLAALLALGISGCGGSKVEYQEVPGNPAEITLPERTPESDAEASADEDAAVGEEAPAATATPATDAGAATGETAGGDPATAEATPAPVEDGPDSDEPPVPGSDAERFEDFCAQNAGAC